MPRFSRTLAILLLVLLLLPAALQAAETRRDAGPARSGPSALLAWDVLARVWSFLARAAADNGCEADPSGRCLPRQGTTATADNGCEVDPSGRCHQ